MGTGKISQVQKKSQEIHVNTHQTLQNQNPSVPLQKDKNMPESMSAIKSVFQIKSEKIENITLLKKEYTSDANEFCLLPVSGVPDFAVEQRRTSIMRQEALPREANRLYVRERNAWQEVRENQPILNYPEELRASNAALIELTNRLIQDPRSASPSFRAVRSAMRVLTKLCELDEKQNYEKMTADFGAQYETAYQDAVLAVNEYLTSHSGWRWTSQGRERKRWMKELRQKLELHKKYAAQIISGYSAITEFSDRFAKGEAQEEIEEETAIHDSLPETLEISDMQEILLTGEMRQQIKTLINLCSMQRNLKEIGLSDDAGIGDIREQFMEKVKNSPLADSVEYTRILVCVCEGLKQRMAAFVHRTKAEAPEGTDPEIYAEMKLQKETFYEQYQSCVTLTRELEQQSVGVLMKKEQQQEQVEAPVNVEATDPVQVLRENCQQMEQNLSDPAIVNLSRMLRRLLQEDPANPADKIAYRERLYTAQAEFSDYVQKHPDMEFDKLALCLSVIEQMNHVERRLPQPTLEDYLPDRNLHYSQPQNRLIGSERMNRYEEADRNLPSQERQIEFIGSTNNLPVAIQKCGDKKVLEQYLRDNKAKLSTQLQLHLQNRILICERLDQMEREKTNEIPSECAVYRGNRRIPLDQADLEEDKFILEDVIQSHYQTHGNSCWSAAAENLFRQRNVFLHQVDARGFRDSEMEEDELYDLAGDRQHDILGIRNLVGKVMKNTILSKQQLWASESDVYSHMGEVVAHMKHTLREAIIKKRSAVAICFGHHYRTIVGIQGNTVYYKNSSGGPSFYMDPDKTFEMSITKMIEDATTAEGLNLDMYWMRDIPEGANLTEEYEGKIGSGISLNITNGEYRVSSDPSQYGTNQTVVDVGVQGKGRPDSVLRVYHTDFLPRYAN